jgi:hypothetical protein
LAGSVWVCAQAGISATAQQLAASSSLDAGRMEWRTQCESTMTISSLMDESGDLTSLQQASQQHSRHPSIKQTCLGWAMSRLT